MPFQKQDVDKVITSGIGFDYALEKLHYLKPNTWLQLPKFLRKKYWRGSLNHFSGNQILNRPFLYI